MNRPLPASHATNKLQGLPDWITPELIQETLAVWQPQYKERLTQRDAVEILLSVGNLIDLLGDTDDEAVPGAGAGL